MKDYFQNEEITTIIFKHLRDNSKNVIDVNPFKERYNANNDLFIHIRLGDVRHRNMGIEYYKYCIDFILKKQNCDKIYIGSDELNHDMIKKLISIYPEIILLKKKHVETIQFGSTCKNVILSHGSFSAVIGYLSFFSNIYFPNKTPLWCPLDMLLNKGFIPVDIVNEGDTSNTTWQILPQENQYRLSVVSDMTNNEKKNRFIFILIHNGDQERYSFMMNQFEQHGIGKENVDIILHPNKNEITDDLHKEIAVNHEKTTKGQSCVTYKHYLALKKIAESKCDMGIIIEDNIEFNGNVYDAIERYIRDMDEYWDILFDSDILSNKMTRFNPPRDKNGKSVIRSPNGSKSKGANFVLIHSRCIHKILNSYLPYILHSDHNYNRVINENKLISYWAVPYNVHYRNMKSTWK